MKYWYVSYVGYEKQLIGNSIISMPTFDIVLLHKLVKEKEKQVCIILTFNEVSESEYNNFIHFCNITQKKHLTLVPTI